MPFFGLTTQVLNEGIWIASTLPGKVRPTPVYYCFRKWQRIGLWEQLQADALVIRKRQRREETPSLLAFDSQSTKIVNFISLDTVIDGGKKVNGRKRDLAVDT
ncbi:MAG: hypothetical protein ACLFUB_20760 [Cyclobacteriaceae bacterium]